MKLRAWILATATAVLASATAAGAAGPQRRTCRDAVASAEMRVRASKIEGASRSVQDAEARLATSYQARGYAYRRGVSVGRAKTLDIVDAQGELLGSIEYEVTGRKFTLQYIRTRARGEDLSTHLLDRALAESPEVDSIHCVLAETNQKAYFTATSGFDTETLKRVPPKGHLDALRETPAYKSQERLGFELDEAASPKPGLDDPLVLVTKRKAP